MTARRIFPEKQRRSVYAAAPLVLMMAAVLVAAGCMDQTPTITQTSHQTTTFTDTQTVPISTVMTIPTICPQPTNGSYWIVITPISNVTAGSPVLVNGSTNIPSGGLLNVRLSHPTREKTATPTMKGNVNIVKNGNCTNTFAMIFITPEMNVDPRGTNIEVEVYSPDTTLPGYNYPWNQTVFYLFNQTIF